MNIAGLPLDDWRSWLKGSLLFLAVALPTAFYLRTYDSAMVKITVLQLGVLTAAAIWTLGSLWEGRMEFPGESLGLLAPALLLLVWNAGRFAFAAHRWASLSGFVDQEAFLSLFLLTAVCFSRRGLRLAVMIVLGGWLISVLYGASQYLGLDPFIWKGAFGERVFSTFGNPNFFAAYLVLCAPLPLAMAADEDLPSWLRGAFAVLAVIGAFVLGWTRTLTGIWAAVSILPFLFFGARHALGASRRASILALTAACLGICLFGAARSSSRVSAAKDDAFLVETWKGAWTMIGHHPLIGYGPGSFWAEYPAFRRPRVILGEHKHNTETDHPESELLEQWAEAGIAGAILWAWLFAGVLRAGWSALSESGLTAVDEIYGTGIFATVLGGTILALVSVMARFAAPGWLLYFAAGLLCAWCRPGRDQGGAVFALPFPTRATRAVLAAMALTGSGVLAWGSVRLFESDIRHNIAIYWSKEKKWDLALAEYEKEVPGTSTYVMSRYFEGNVFSDRGGPGDAQRALEKYREVRALAPDYVEVHHQEAVVLDKLGLKREAIEAMEAETRIDPVWDEPWDWLAKRYLEAGQPDKAAFAAERAKSVKASWEAFSP
jgi:O-antigen ligase